MADPFTQIELGLWAKIIESSTFTQLVPLGNRIKFCVDANADPEKDQLSDGDYPNVMIMPTSHGLDQHASNSSIWIQRYNVVCQTGDKRTSWKYNPIKFEVCKMLTRLFNTNLDTLSTAWAMPTGTRVVRIWPGEASDALGESAKVREGWMSLFPITVEFQMTESAFATP